MRLSWVIKKGTLRSCHKGKCKCHPKPVMRFSHEEKCDHYVFLSIVPKLSGVPLTEVKTVSV